MGCDWLRNLAPLKTKTNRDLLPPTFFALVFSFIFYMYFLWVLIDLLDCLHVLWLVSQSNYFGFGFNWKLLWNLKQTLENALPLGELRQLEKWCSFPASEKTWNVIIGDIHLQPKTNEKNAQ